MVAETSRLEQCLEDGTLYRRVFDPQDVLAPMLTGQDVRKDLPQLIQQLHKLSSRLRKQLQAAVQSHHEAFLSLTNAFHDLETCASEGTADADRLHTSTEHALKPLTSFQSRLTSQHIALSRVEAQKDSLHQLARGAELSNQMKTLLQEVSSRLPHTNCSHEHTCALLVCCAYCERASTLYRQMKTHILSFEMPQVPLWQKIQTRSDMVLKHLEKHLAILIKRFLIQKCHTRHSALFSRWHGINSTCLHQLRERA